MHAIEVKKMRRWQGVAAGLRKTKPQADARSGRDTVSQVGRKVQTKHGVKSSHPSSSQWTLKSNIIYFNRLSSLLRHALCDFQ